MTPKVWLLMIKGAKEKELDQLEINIHQATANAMAQGGKSLRGMVREIANSRKSLYMSKEEIRRDKELTEYRNKHIRKRQIEAGNKFIEAQKKMNKQE